MKILIVGLVNNIQIQRLSEEAKKKGHSVVGCYTKDLAIFGFGEKFDIKVRGESIEDYDLIYLWAVGKRRFEWYTAALYLHQKFGTIIVNKKAVDAKYNYYLTPAIDYLRQTQEGINYPKSIVAFTTNNLDRFLKEFSYPIIVKRSNGRQGKGVYLVDSKANLQKVTEEILQEDNSFVIREFIPNDGDVRVFTVGYRAIGAMKRTPKSGDFRSNISQGGMGEKFDLEKNPKIREIAEKLSEVMQTEIAGVDIMIHKLTGVPYVLEINPGPQFEGLEKYCKVNAAGAIIEYFENLQGKK